MIGSSVGASDLRLYWIPIVGQGVPWATTPNEPEHGGRMRQHATVTRG